MYGRMKKKLLKEIFALTICLRMKAGAESGLGTPFSYAVPGQSNELVLMEWSSDPLQLLVNNEVQKKKDWIKIQKAIEHGTLAPSFSLCLNSGVWLSY